MSRPRLPPDLARRLAAGARRLHGLGPRALAEFLAELGGDRAMLPGILAMLETWQARLTPRMLRTAGADGFPPVATPLPAERDP